jgi:putative transcriptional regulator
VVLRPATDRRRVKPVSAALVLVEHGGLTMLRAKRTIDAMMERGEVAARLPAVNMQKLPSELHSAGVYVSRIVDELVDVRALRESLKMTQEQFATRYNLSLDVVQHWEQGDRRPDRAANSYLRVIAANPGIAGKAQEEALEAAR